MSMMMGNTSLSHSRHIIWDPYWWFHRSVDTYINNRGHDKSLKPDWRDAGRTHGGMHLEGTRPYIFFGRMTLSGKSDYMWLQYAPGNSEETYTKINWWRNYGTGGRVLKAVSTSNCSDSREVILICDRIIITIATWMVMAVSFHLIHDHGWYWYVLYRRWLLSGVTYRYALTMSWDFCQANSSQEKFSSIETFTIHLIGDRMVWSSTSIGPIKTSA